LNKISIDSDNRRIIYREMNVSRLLTGLKHVDVNNTIRRIYNMCPEAHVTASNIIFNNHSYPDFYPLKQTICKDIIRNTLLSWFPIFSNKKCSSDMVLMFRDGEYATLSSLLFFNEQAEEWLNKGPEYWEYSLLVKNEITSLWCKELHKLPELEVRTISSPGLFLLKNMDIDVSSYAIYSNYLEKMKTRHEAVLRFFSRIILLARTLERNSQLHWNRFNYIDWKVGVVETARGWLVHMAKISDEGIVIDYKIISPTTYFTSEDGLLSNTLKKCQGDLLNKYIVLLAPGAEV